MRTFTAISFLLAGTVILGFIGIALGTYIDKKMEISNEPEN